jgi:hypothetical protein
MKHILDTNLNDVGYTVTSGFDLQSPLVKVDSKSNFLTITPR